MGKLRGKTSRWVRSRSPIFAELAMVRKIRSTGLASELLYELGSIPRDRRRLAELRNGRDVCWTEPEGETDPLVTVRICTKDRPELLIERSLASVMRQTYTNIEILVVGDHCDDRTADALAEIDDPRLRYVNLGRQGDYPTDPVRRWQVAGSKPMTAALYLASGHWIAPCDDDDEFVDTHVEHLLRFAQRERMEFVWGRTQEFGSGPESRFVGHEVMSFAATNHGAVFYSMGLAAIPYSPTADRMLEPFDWNLWKRMQLAGARMAFLDELVYLTWPAGAEQYEEKAS